MMRPFCRKAFLLCLVGFLCISSRLTAEEKPLTVFVFAGQSNMVGKRSKAELLPESLRGEQPNVLIFDGKQWVPYRAGLGQPAGFGPEVSAAFEMAAALGKPVGIVKHSIGGTNLAVRWNPTRKQNLYTVLKAKVAAAKAVRPVKVAGVFWMQGGADARSEKSGEAYADNLDLLIAALRRDFEQPTLPFVAGRSGRGSTKTSPRYPAMTKVRAGQEKARPGYAWIDCDNITVGSDQIHYDTPGIVNLGRQMAVAMKTLLNIPPEAE